MKKPTKEDKAFHEKAVVPELEKVKALANSFLPEEYPEIEGDLADLTPEQEAEICRRIRKIRGHNDD